ncbi:hypothetical protein BGZ70_002392 [Mortierella alpina]|uniref:BTB domain-containing protein n=1 Tax=Mortierella alpina TaxID=64518 RepID=A0A9P6JEL2_MORAP|nr:hypothetical protein BGZ70_002392 [Mortierella alpina]
MADLQILQFRIPAYPPPPPAALLHPQLTPPRRTKLLPKRASTRGRVAAYVKSGSDATHILLHQRIKDGDLLKGGVEFYLNRQDIWVDQFYEFLVILSSFPLKLLGPPDGPHWTHALALSESDPVARNIDPLVEMLTRFERHLPTTDVECRVVSPKGQIVGQLRAHRAILSVYPALSEKLSRSSFSSTGYILDVPLIARGSFEAMLSFIYSEKLPRDLFVPRSEQWEATFGLAKEFGLDKHENSEPWMDWHLSALHQAITDEDVLEIFFEWGHRYRRVTQMCVEHVAERFQVPFREKNLGTFVMDQLRNRYQGRQGCCEFQEALVFMTMKSYALQRQQHAEYSEQRKSRPIKGSISSLAELDLTSYSQH